MGQFDNYEPVELGEAVTNNRQVALMAAASLFQGKGDVSNYQVIHHADKFLEFLESGE